MPPSPAEGESQFLVMAVVIAMVMLMVLFVQARQEEGNGTGRGRNGGQVEGMSPEAGVGRWWGPGVGGRAHWPSHAVVHVQLCVLVSPKDLGMTTGKDPEAMVSGTRAPKKQGKQTNKVRTDTVYRGTQAKMMSPRTDNSRFVLHL